MLEEGSGGAGTAPQSLRRRRGFWIRLGLGVAALVVVLTVAVGQLVVDGSASKTPSTDLAAATRATTSSTSPPTTVAPTTTTTIPPLAQPAPAMLPPVPGGLAEAGSTSPEVAAYEQRLVDLHFDPGPVDGEFDGKTRYAIEAVEKILGWERNGTIDQPMVDALAKFAYPAPREPRGGADRVEIDLDTQVLTVYKHHQVALISTTSTGTGRKFCGGSDGCQYAVTPAGTYEFQRHVNGWRDGDLGRLYNPWYFNGGIAVHGYSSVPTHPASHGCARIPMHIAEYFGTLAYNGMPVYVVGTPAPPSGGPLPPDNPNPPKSPSTPQSPPSTPAPQRPTPTPPTRPPTTPPPTTAAPTTTSTTTTTTTTTTTVAPPNSA